MYCEIIIDHRKKIKLNWLQGVWGGMLCGIALQTLILLFVVWRTDWKSEVIYTFSFSF